MGIFSKLKQAWFGDVNWEKLDDEFFDNLEESLILADVGVNIAAESVNSLRNAVFSYDMKDPEQVKAELRKILLQKLSVGETALDTAKSPTVILVIGVNGVGKTTSIGKLANRLKAEGKKVLLCAADTFRAAAADQLEIWAKRADVPIVRQHEGADPGAVLFDALQAAKARNIDVVLCDTAGRLHNKQNLMNELAKLRKIIDRELPEAGRETLLVLDATTGQNGLIQARSFKETAGLTGIVLTKLDGTAKGGIVIAIARELGVPVKFVGVGEGIDDLKPFDPEKLCRILSTIQFRQSQNSRYIELISDRTPVKIPVRSILYVDTYRNAVQVHTTDAGIIRSYITFQKFEELLEGMKCFLSCYRGCIVNMDHIEKSTDEGFVMDNQELVTVRKRGSNTIKKAYLEYLFSSDSDK